MVSTSFARELSSARRKKAIGATLKDRRERLDWSLERLARESGFSVNKVWRIEAGEAAVRLDDLDKLAELLGLRVDKLIALDAPMLSGPKRKPEPPPAKKKPKAKRKAPAVRAPKPKAKTPARKPAAKAPVVKKKPKRKARARREPRQLEEKLTPPPMIVERVEPVEVLEPPTAMLEDELPDPAAPTPGEGDDEEAPTGPTPAEAPPGPGADEPESPPPDEEDDDDGDDGEEDDDADGEEPAEDPDRLPDEPPPAAADEDLVEPARAAS
jgi:transcriptional regulator with XRE-family HTH domain